MVSKSIGSIFKRKDEKYFVYLPKALVEDTSFPFPITSSIKVKVKFEPGHKRIIIEK